MGPGYSGTDMEDDVVVEAARLARAYAGNMVAPDLAEDVAQDVALAVLRRVRRGMINEDCAALRPLVWRMVHARVVDLVRRTRSRLTRDATFVRDRDEGQPSWMSPSDMLDGAELGGLYQRTLAGVSEACRRAYVMVREERLTYAEVAQALSVSSHTVGAYVFTVQREFRRALEAAGLPSDYTRRRPRRAA